jgi:hypothetical protein
MARQIERELPQEQPQIALIVPVAELAADTTGASGVHVDGRRDADDHNATSQKRNVDSRVYIYRKRDNIPIALHDFDPVIAAIHVAGNIHGAQQLRPSMKHEQRRSPSDLLSFSQQCPPSSVGRLHSGVSSLSLSEGRVPRPISTFEPRTAG